MRLGQGFNSYSQRICINDAVIVSPNRPENFLSNDGQTMRTMLQAKNQPSLWTQSVEVLTDEDRLKEAYEATQALLGGRIDELSDRRQEEIRAWQRRERRTPLPEPGSNNPAPPPYEAKQTAPGVEPIYKASTRTWRINNVGGPSQTVIFTSRFVSDLSQVTSDMGISASLSIKAGMVAGSGRGSFIDSDKFLESDLNLFISCKVVNQTTNFRDPLEFNPLPDGIVDASRWLETYGDCYISAFLEGGEFQAIVSMKILNKARLTEIEAAAKVAFSTGALDIEASAAFKLAKANINLNTETTITASWSGGGNIKPPNEPWTIESLIRAANRFPQNVANSPQRTQAVLTPYDHLRSYMAQMPQEISKFSYDNAILYTDELMDYFMVYKSLMNSLSVDIREIQNNTKRFRVIQPPPPDDVIEGRKVYEASIDGLEEACADIRGQLSLIAARVDWIEKHPWELTTAANKKYKDLFLSPVQFWTGLPVVESVRTGQASRPPLSGLRIGPDPTKGADGKDKAIGAGSDAAAEAQMANFCEPQPEGLSLTPLEEKKCLARVEADKNAPSSATIGAPSTPKKTKMRLTRPMGSREDGTAFFGFDFLRSYVPFRSLTIGIAQGAVASLSVTYANGLQLRRGRSDDEQDCFHLNADWDDGEVILNGSIEVGKPAAEGSAIKGTITSIKLVTSKGRELHARARKQIRYGYQCRYLDGHLYNDLEEISFEAPLPKAVLCGFYGMSSEGTDLKTVGVHRLGFLWAVPPSNPATESTEETAVINTFATVTEPLHGLKHVTPIVEAAYAATLLPIEREAILGPFNRAKHAGLRFGPVLGSEQGAVAGTTPTGSIFNTNDLLLASATQTLAGQSTVPTQLSFIFARGGGAGSAQLVAIRGWYGRFGFLHGSMDADPFSSPSSYISLDLKLQKGESVRVLRFVPGEKGSMPVSLSVTTSEGRSAAVDARSGSKSDSATALGQGSIQEVNAPSGSFGLKGFFGLESVSGFSRLLPIWA
ncbi:hypothetical protein OC861_006616 [Tilletia horrida]|nr:hypothetical protein OC861_006616 [Tilletia horrida]